MIKIEKDNYCVYIHTNKINGKVYIGQTKHGDNLEKRWKGGWGYSTCYYFNNAIQKYGWDNFSHEVLKSGLWVEEANAFEEDKIEKYHSTDPDYGYNIKKGGENHEMSERTKMLIQLGRQKYKEEHQTEIQQDRVQKSIDKYKKRFDEGDKHIKICEKCGAYYEIPKSKSNKSIARRKYCDCCNPTKHHSHYIMLCTDCGNPFVRYSKFRSKRCEDCKKKREKERKRLNTQRYRARKK